MQALPHWWAVSLLALMYSGLALGSEPTPAWPKPLPVILAVVSSNAGPAAWSRTQQEFSELLDQSSSYTHLETEELAPQSPNTPLQVVEALNQDEAPGNDGNNSLLAMQCV